MKRMSDEPTETAKLISYTHAHTYIGARDSNAWKANFRRYLSPFIIIIRLFRALFSSLFVPPQFGIRYFANDN